MLKKIDWRKMLELPPFECVDVFLWMNGGAIVFQSIQAELFIHYDITQYNH